MTHRLLVIDNNTTVQRVIKLAFKDEAITVSTMASSRGFEQIEANPPDIVLADNGREVATFLKSRPKLSHIPVVLLKGAFDPANEGPDEAAGCDDVLMKPLQPLTMIDCVKQLLHGQKAGVRSSPARAIIPGGKVGKVLDSGRKTPLSQEPAKRTDSDVTLEQYFDQLKAAFGRAESAAPQLPGDAWLWEPAAAFSRSSIRPQAEISVKNVPIAGEKPPRPMSADDLVEQVTQRVLDRLNNRLVRSTATEIVSRLSRWLIVDEVERTKN